MQSQVWGFGGLWGLWFTLSVYFVWRILTEVSVHGCSVSGCHAQMSGVWVDAPADTVPGRLLLCQDFGSFLSEILGLIQLAFIFNQLGTDCNG